MAPEVQHIVNFGIAGVLNAKLTLEVIYPIRSLYRYGVHQPFFNSFTTALGESQVDIVSTDHRVLSPTLAASLRPFGDLVDMEAYFIASIAKRYNKNLYVFKCASDRAGDNRHCLDLQNQGLKYSNQFLQYYHKWDQQIKKTPESSPKKRDLRDEFVPLPPAFYLTTSQKFLFDKLLLAIAGDKPCLNQLKKNIKELADLTIAPKKRTKKLIENMQLLSNPYLANFKKELEKAGNIFKPQDIRLAYNPASEKISVQYEIENETQWKKKSAYLQSHPPKLLFSLLDPEHE